MKDYNFLLGKQLYEARRIISLAESTLYLARDATKMLTNLLEVVADIAYIAGENKYFSGDSRQDNSEFIRWAKEFASNWGWDENNDDLDYIEEIQKFTLEKLAQVENNL